MKRIQCEGKGNLPFCTLSSSGWTNNKIDTIGGINFNSCPQRSYRN